MRYPVTLQNLFFTTEQQDYEKFADPLLTIDKNANKELNNAPHSHPVAKSNQCPTAEGTLWTRFGQ